MHFVVDGVANNCRVDDVLFSARRDGGGRQVCWWYL